MKKILCSIFAASLMLLGTSAFAQVAIGAGYVQSKYTYKTGNSSGSGDSANGFYAGLEYKVPVGEVFGLSAGVNYELLASKNYNIGAISGNLKEHYINVPVRLNAGVNLGDQARLFIFGGPTFSYALAGKVDLGVKVGSFDIGGTYDIYKDGGYNRFDVLVGGGVGLDLMDRFRVTAGYDLGMFNKLAKGSDGTEPSTKLNRNQLHAGIAFLF